MEEKTVDKLLEDMKDVPDKMRLFSRNMRALYAEKNTVSTSEYAEQFNGLRYELKRQALYYMKLVNPLNVSTVQNLKDLFEEYELMDLDDWIENLDDVIVNVGKYRKLCKILEEEHKKILIPLKKVEDEVNSLLPKVESLNKEMEDIKKKLTGSVAPTYACAVSAGLVEPSLLLVTLPIATVLASIMKSKAAVLDGKVEVNDALIVTASTAMIPALEVFIGNVEALAGFFAVLYQELTSLRNCGDRAKKEMHFKIMKKKASKITNYCDRFFTISPQFDTDILVLLESVDDKSMSEWLDENQKALQEDLTVSLGELTGLLSLK